MPVLDLKVAYTVGTETCARLAIASIVIAEKPVVRSKWCAAFTMRCLVSAAWRSRVADLYVRFLLSNNKILASLIRYSHPYPICEVYMEETGRTDTAAAQHHRKLVVLGATGATGLEVVRQATERGHSVTAFVRSPDRLVALENQITTRTGDLLNSGQLAQVIEGHDAVVSAFGPRLPVSKADAHLLQRFATALASAMEQTAVRRVVVESVAFLFKDSIIPPAHLLGRLLFPTIVADSAAMEGIFQKSALEWTMVRPPELTNKPYTGRYRVREGHLPRFGFKISRADVANFMIRAVEDRISVRKVVGLSN